MHPGALPPLPSEGNATRPCDIDQDRSSEAMDGTEDAPAATEATETDPEHTIVNDQEPAWHVAHYPRGMLRLFRLTSLTSPSRQARPDIRELKYPKNCR
ncbi:hypothetical protein IscW_ISCW011841 [Ixodes scapularis]|uniref:Uncharacterized protein n=1 Tax=Ixodes scapularis TaxID=6945 RepID=B7Q6R9_IXOSC|nr:hypothetical protein IscW_ISCW011841 [Ixodes scapularis]|eukprot:XP_002412024.1 hypothetical protein IscW_ISCW011841 [Ixodes scapularis]